RHTRWPRDWSSDVCSSDLLTGLHFRLSGQSILAHIFPQNLQNGKDPLTFQGLAPSGEHAFGYDIPNLMIDHAMRNPHVPPGFWRSEERRVGKEWRRWWGG